MVLVLRQQIQCCSGDYNALHRWYFTLALPSLIITICLNVFELNTLACHIPLAMSSRSLNFLSIVLFLGLWVQGMLRVISNPFHDP